MIEKTTDWPKLSLRTTRSLSVVMHLAEVPVDVLAISAYRQDFGVVIKRRGHVAGQLVASTTLSAVDRLVPATDTAVVLADAVVVPVGGATHDVGEIVELYASRLDAVQICDPDVIRTGVVGSAQGLPYL